MARTRDWICQRSATKETEKTKSMTIFCVRIKKQVSNLHSILHTVSPHSDRDNIQYIPWHAASWLDFPPVLHCVRRCDFPRMATSLTLIATIKLANRNANNKWYGPQHARKISEKGTEDKDWASRWKSVVEGKRATRLSVSVGFHGEDMRKRWRAALIVFNSCFYWPCPWRKAFVTHRLGIITWGEERLCTQTDRDSI